MTDIDFQAGMLSLLERIALALEDRNKSQRTVVDNFFQLASDLINRPPPVGLCAHQRYKPDCTICWPPRERA